MSRIQRQTIRKAAQFSCPLSPHIAWNWGLQYKDCPVVAGERDMDECRTCPLRGNAAEELKKDRPRPRRDRDDRNDRNRKRAGRPADGTTPNKGKSYIG